MDRILVRYETLEIEFWLLWSCLPHRHRFDIQGTDWFGSDPRSLLLFYSLLCLYDYFVALFVRLLYYRLFIAICYFYLFCKKDLLLLCIMTVNLFFMTYYRPIVKQSAVICCIVTSSVIYICLISVSVLIYLLSYRTYYVL